MKLADLRMLTKAALGIIIPAGIGIFALYHFASRYLEIEAFQQTAVVGLLTDIKETGRSLNRKGRIASYDYDGKMNNVPVKITVDANNHLTNAEYSVMYSADALRNHRPGEKFHHFLFKQEGESTFTVLARDVGGTNGNLAMCIIAVVVGASFIYVYKRSKLFWALLSATQAHKSNPVQLSVRER